MLDHRQISTELSALKERKPSGKLWQQSHTKLKIGTAADVGMSQDVLLQAEAILQSEIVDRRITAAALTVARNQTIVHSKGYGHLTRRQIQILSNQILFSCWHLLPNRLPLVP